MLLYVICHIFLIGPSYHRLLTASRQVNAALLLPTHHFVLTLDDGHYLNFTLEETKAQ